MKLSRVLAIGQVYSRAELRERFGIKDATINNGIFRPKGHKSVWLFVTKDKTADRTQYHDALEGDVLTMQGQTSGRTDDLIINHAEQGLELLLFYRGSKFEHPGAGFVYEGPFRYEQHVGKGPATFTLHKVGQYKYGMKRTWELALDAVIALGGQASIADTASHILGHYPDYNQKNLAADLAMLSVNSLSRTSYSPNAHPRRTNQGSEFDRLFKIGSGRGVVFMLYDPIQHGVWEIYPNAAARNRTRMAVRQVVNPVAEVLDAVANEVEQVGVFDVKNMEDARLRVHAGIVRRGGQPTFRKALMEAYGGACAITGCDFPAVLEAAHVHPYMGNHTNVISNGLLLRTDIHILFDLGLIAIEPKSLRVLVSPDLVGTEYAWLEGVTVRCPAALSQRVSPDALDWHRSRCGW